MPRNKQFKDWREEDVGLVGLAGYTESGATFEWEDGAEVVTGARVTRDFFGVMGATLAMGRSFTEEEDRLGGPRAVILSHALWTNRFGADPDILERTAPMAGGALPIIGVAAEGFRAPGGSAEFWVPLQEDQLLADVGLPTGTRTLSFIDAIGRLESGADLETVEADLRARAKRIDEAVGQSEEQMSDVTLVSLADWTVGDVRQSLLMLLAAASLVLIVAIANVVALAVSRSAARRREMALRSALGAARGRLLRQVLAEGLLAALAAGALGTMLAWALQTGLLRLAPAELPRADSVAMGLSTLLFASAATLVSGLLFGLVPGLDLVRTGSRGRLGGTRGSSADRHELRLQHGLVSFQLSATVVLLTGAILLTTSFARLLGVDTGFDAESVVVAELAPSESTYERPEEIRGLYASVLERVRALPGVSYASTTWSPPMFDNGFRTSVVPEGQEEDEANRFWAGTVVIGTDYFETNGIELREGRPFDSSDGIDAPPVVIVNQRLADRLWPDESAVGKRIAFTGALRGSADSFSRDFFPAEAMTVVGVADDIRRESLGAEPGPEYYRPHTQVAWGFQYLMVKTATDPRSVAAVLREAVWSVDPTIPVASITTLREQVMQSVAPQRFRMLLVLVFAGLTCLLAMVGLYAVMALAVSRRIREMGIRMALGARRTDVTRDVLGRGARVVGLGAVMGLLAAWVGARMFSALLETMLYEIEPTSPLVYVLVVSATASIGLMACWVPARRAAAVDPVVSLREE